jgi:formate-dependent phosphoribosylglycinamide formyltransferase (GAR transformylase)
VLRWLRLCRTVRSLRRPTRGDGPAVVVFDPVGGREAKAAVVAAGDDDISDTGLVPVSQAHLTAGRVIAEEMITGLSVEVVDQLSGRGEHDRVQSCGPVGHPSREGVLGGGEVADMNSMFRSGGRG